MTKRTGPLAKDRPDQSTTDTVPQTDDELIVWLGGYLTGCERGYWEKTAEINRDWPPPKVRVFGRWYDQLTYRQEWDRRAAQPWPTDNEVR